MTLLPVERPVAADPSDFTDLVRYLSTNDLAAVRLVREGRSVLPSRYSEGTQASLRSCIEALEFAQALELLAPADRIAGPPIADEATHRILLVDDVATTLHVLRSMLEGIGALRYAKSSAEALRVAALWTPDLVLCDVNLDERSGLDVCRELKRVGDGLEPAVILISSQADVASEVAALTAGADDFIEKPLQIARVVGRVQTQLARRARAGALAARDVARLMPQHLGFVICRVDGQVVNASPGLERLLDLSLETSNWRLDQVVKTSDTETLSSLISDAVLMGRLERTNASLAIAGGQSIPVRLTGWMAPGSEGRVLWIVVEDLRKQIVRERRKLDTAVARAVAAMCGGIAHEFNNVLNIVDGHIQLAADELQPSHPAHVRLGQASAALERAAALSRRMGLFAWHAEDAIVGTPEELVDQLWPLLCAHVGRRAMLRHVRGETGCAIQVHLSSLRTALEHLLDNACDAMPHDRPEIIIRTSREIHRDGAAFAVLEIEDRGAGMTEDVRHRAFDPFFTTSAPRRTGLGLTEVRAFVSRYGGTIELHSARPCGTLVRMRLPCAQSPLTELGQHRRVN